MPDVPNPKRDEDVSSLLRRYLPFPAGQTPGREIEGIAGDLELLDRPILLPIACRHIVEAPSVRIGLIEHRLAISRHIAADRLENRRLKVEMAHRRLRHDQGSARSGLPTVRCGRRRVIGRDVLRRLDHYDRAGGPVDLIGEIPFPMVCGDDDRRAVVDP